MTNSIEADVLSDLVPLRELDDAALRALAAEAEIEEVPARSVIFRKGEEDAYIRYVLSGEVVLVEQPGEQRTLVGMGDAGAAAEPLGLGGTHRFSALARTDVRLIRLPAVRIRQALEAARLPAADVEEAREDTPGEALFYQLVRDLMEDRLALPGMPDIAVRVRKLVADPEAGPNDVIRVLQADPTVAAQLLKTANSALYAASAKADSLRSAVMRLGLRTVREVVTAVTMREVFRAANPLLHRRMVELWMHSTLVAAIASVMARSLKGFDPDQALLAGLIHDIGAVPLVAHAGDHPELAADPRGLEQVIAQHQGEIGVMILRRWNFSEELVHVPAEAESWYRYHDGPADYADLLVAAQLESMAGTRAADRYPSLSQVPALGRLVAAGLELGDSHSIRDQARDEIAEVQRLLTG
mgnify:CR=1 FL=1